MSTPADLDTPMNLETQRLIRKKWGLGGIAVGIVVGLVLTGVLFLSVGWRIFPGTLVWSLVFLPILARALVLRKCPVPPPTSRPKERMTLGDVMLMVAYLGLLLGMTISTAPLGMKAAQYHSMAISNRSMIQLFMAQANKAAADIKLRTANADALEQRKIPPGILPLQQEFLRKLDAEGPASLREERYGLIGETERWQAELAEGNVVAFRSRADHYKALAEKYERAERQPLLPVEPDPQLPGTVISVPPTVQTPPTAPAR